MACSISHRYEPFITLQVHRWEKREPWGERERVCCCKALDRMDKAQSAMYYIIMFHFLIWDSNYKQDLSTDKRHFFLPPYCVSNRDMHLHAPCLSACVNHTRQVKGEPMMIRLDSLCHHLSKPEYPALNLKHSSPLGFDLKPVWCLNVKIFKHSSW